MSSSARLKMLFLIHVASLHPDCHDSRRMLTTSRAPRSSFQGFKMLFSTLCTCNSSVLNLDGKRKVILQWGTYKFKQYKSSALFSIVGGDISIRSDRVEVTHLMLSDHRLYHTGRSHMT